LEVRYSPICRARCRLPNSAPSPNNDVSVLARASETKAAMRRVSDYTAQQDTTPAVAPIPRRTPP
jgi:hypothetical protein